MTNLLDQFNLSWPWMGLGIAGFMLVLLFKTDLFCVTKTNRTKDIVWLAFLAAPVYMLHQFEEYSLSYDWLSHTYTFANGVCHAFGYEPYPACEFPRAFFPVVNITLAWVAAPLAGLFARKNPMVGVSLYGIILANGLLHFVGLIAQGGLFAMLSDLANGVAVAKNSGVITGTLIFIPLSIWVAYVGVSQKFLSKKQLLLAYLAGLIGHILLVVAYFVFKIAGSPAMLFMGGFSMISPLLIAFWFSKLAKF